MQFCNERNVFMKLWNTTPPFTVIEGFEPSITEYIIKNSGSAILVCPGGGYAMRAEHEGPQIAEWLNKNGISAFVLDYRVGELAHLGYAPLSDAMRAMKYIRRNADKWGIAPDKIAVMGFSAGAHLAGSLSVHYNMNIYSDDDELSGISCRPDASVLCYPVIDMFEYRHDGSRQNLIGEFPLHSDKELMSLHKHITTDTPPAFLWHTSSDATVPVENTFLYAEGLSKVNVPFEIHIYPAGEHGLGLAPKKPHVAQWGDSMLKWLEFIGFKK